MLRSLSLLGISMAMGLSVAAQGDIKVKTGDNETKIKSEDLKIKEESAEGKFKARDLKMKDEKSERKIKAKVQPMRISATERTVIRTGETQVRTKDHLAPIAEPVTATPSVPAPVAVEQVDMSKATGTVRKATSRKYAARRSTAHKRTTGHKGNTARKYVVRTKIVRDTVFVPSPPERIVATQREYVHDTVLVTRVDTVVRMQTTNTYAGYRVPKGNFKKVKLKREKDGDVWMKRKE